jgi:hypothetical protein
MPFSFRKCKSRFFRTPLFFAEEQETTRSHLNCPVDHCNLLINDVRLSLDYLILYNVAMVDPLVQIIPDDINGLAREHQGKDADLKELDFRRSQLRHYLQ